MSQSIMPHAAPTVNHSRFVAPISEYEQGKALHKARKPLGECVTDDMAAGWLDAADLAGALAYIDCMEAEGLPFPDYMF